MANQLFNYGGYGNQLNTGGIGGYQVPTVPNVGSNNTGVGAGSGVFQSISDLWNGDGFFGRNSVMGGTNEKGVTTKGWAPMALGVGQAIFGGIQGQQAMKLAQDQFKEGKRQFNLNYGAQRQTINTELEDRQRARVASNPGAYESVSAYLDKNSVK